MSRQDVINILIRSGLTCTNKSVVLFFLGHHLLMKVFRFKVSPELLLRSDLRTEEFSRILSEISIGPAYKTTSFGRHDRTDELLAKKIFSLENKKTTPFIIADLGASDGAASLALLERLEPRKNIQFHLYDKYPSLQMQKKGLLTIYSNSDHEIVYVKALGIILYLFPLHITVAHNNRKTTISFDNPCLSVHGLQIEYFDIFRSQTPSAFDCIICANILHPAYFPRQMLIAALSNLFKNLSLDGLLCLTHNEPHGEKFLLFKKTSLGLSVCEESDDHALIQFLEIQNGFLALSDQHERLF